MNKVMTVLGKLEQLMSRKSPSILAGTAIAGTITSAYMWYKAGPKVEKIKKNYESDKRLIAKGDIQAEKDLHRQYTADIAMAVAPATIMTGATIGCVIGSKAIDAKRIAVLSAAYSVSESTARNLENKMEELLGEKKARQIKDAIVKDKLRSDNNGNAPTDSSKIIMTGKGDVLCKDLYSGRFLRSNAQMIESAVAKLSYDMLSEMYVSVNDFYDEIGLERVPMGNDLGWTVDDTDHGKLPITLTATLTEDKQPCLCIDYELRLMRSYR